MKRNQAAAVKLCPALADRGGLYCTGKKVLPIADWCSISFNPTIHSAIAIDPKPPVEVLFHRKNPKRCPDLATIVKPARKSKSLFAPYRICHKEFPWLRHQKQLVRSRVKVV